MGHSNTAIILKNYILLFLFLKFPFFVLSQGNNHNTIYQNVLKSDSIGLQTINSNWVLETRTFSDSNSYIITDTTQYNKAVCVIEQWAFVKNSKLEIKKIVQYAVAEKKVMYEEDIYIKSLQNDLVQKITLAYNYPTAEFKATIDTTLSDFKLAQNHRILRERIESGVKLCGTATTQMLYNGYKYTVPIPITEAEARKYIKKMGG